MSKAKRIHAFAKAYHVLTHIDDDKDLKKEKLTAADYYIVFQIMSELSGINDKTLETINKSVADWFIKYGFNVKEKGIGWEVSI